MFNSRTPFFVALFLLIDLISAAPVAPTSHGSPSTEGHPAPSCPSNLRPRGSNILLGYNGFNGTPREPQDSKNGQLGAVFYVADAVDLAKLFANGPLADAHKNYVCLVFANADAWALQHKVWVPANARLGNDLNAQYPGSVLFRSHGAAGLPDGHPADVYQMGIRQAQIKSLDMTVNCYPKSCFDNDHNSLDYKKMTEKWNIQEV